MILLVRSITKLNNLKKSSVWYIRDINMESSNDTNDMLSTYQPSYTNKDPGMNVPGKQHIHLELQSLRQNMICE